jgi:hypothetical protein
MNGIRPHELLASLVAVVLVVAALAIADLAGAGGGIALVAIILAAIPGGLYISRTVTHE